MTFSFNPFRKRVNPKHLSKLILLVLVLQLIPIPVYAKPNLPLAVTPNPCDVNLCSSPTPQNNTFNPSLIPSYFGEDRGTFNLQTSITGFKWSTSPTDFLTMNIPTANGVTIPNPLVYFNSTHTIYKLSGTFGTINEFFKPSQYKAKISIEVNLLSSQTICLTFLASSPIVQQKTRTNVSLPSIRAGNEILDWTDIPVSFSPTFNLNSLCISLPIGITNIDPLALDGSGIGNCSAVTTCTATLTTTNTNDIIICGEIVSPAASTYTITDVASLSWSSRANTGNYGGNSATLEQSAKSSGTLSADVITITVGSGTAFMGIICNGVSGANFGSPFDPGANIPKTDNNDAGCPTSGGQFKPCITAFTTTVANDFIYVVGSDTQSVAQAAGSCDGSTCTLIRDGTSPNDVYSEYLIVSSIQTSQTFTFSAFQGGAYAVIADAIQQAGATVTQPIKIIIVNNEPTVTVTISGCGVSNGTFTANNNTKTYTGISASCSITLSLPVDSIIDGYRWNISPHPTTAKSISFTSCSSGICGLYQNTTWKQIFKQFGATPLSPNKWDAVYTSTLTGSFLGVKNRNICSTGTGSSTNGGGQFIVCSINSLNGMDYNTPTTVGSPIGNSWYTSPSGSNIFILTVGGGSTANVNYIQLSNKILVPNYSIDKDPQVMPVVFLFILMGFILILALSRRS